MKLKMLFAITILCTGIAGILLAFGNTSGWGWFLFVAAIAIIAIRDTPSPKPAIKE
jgi:uncharacterized membrane protein HdeD (DUF308 family)